MAAEPNGFQREHLDKDRRYSGGILWLRPARHDYTLSQSYTLD